MAIQYQNPRGSSPSSQLSQYLQLDAEQWGGDNIPHEIEQTDPKSHLSAN